MVDDAITICRPSAMGYTSIAQNFDRQFCIYAPGMQVAQSIFFFLEE
jgi:hypothetical protein